MGKYEGHTPGPWFYSQENGSVFGSGGALVCDLEFGGNAYQGDNNGRLIAAAPELAKRVEELEAWQEAAGHIHLAIVNLADADGSKVNRAELFERISNAAYALSTEGPREAIETLADESNPGPLTAELVELPALQRAKGGEGDNE